MHIKTDTSPAHRHALVAPVFALLLVSSFWLPGHRQLVGAESINDIPGSVSFANAAMALPAPDAKIQVQNGDLLLSQGSIVAGGRDRIAFAAGDAQLLSFDGGFYAAIQDHTLTIAALMSPVLLDIDGERTIIPAGRQWQGTDISLPTLADGWPKWLQARKTISLPSSFTAEQYAVVQKLRNTGCNEQEKCQSDLGQKTLDQLQPLMQSSSLRLLAAFHPEYRELSWRQPRVVDTDLEVRFIRLFLFPESDTLPDPASSGLHDRYQQEVKDFLATQQRPSDFLDLLLPRLQNVVQALQDRSYAERADAYGELVQSFGGKVSALSEATITASGSVSSTAVPVMEKKPACSSENMTEEEMRSWLKAAGALFTTRTSLSLAANGQVTVQDIVFPSEADHLYSFIYQADCSQITNIERDGVQMPNALSLEAFEKWVKGE